MFTFLYFECYFVFCLLKKSRFSESVLCGYSYVRLMSKVIPRGLPAQRPRPRDDQQLSPLPVSFINRVASALSGIPAHLHKEWPSPTIHAALSTSVGASIGARCLCSWHSAVEQPFRIDHRTSCLFKVSFDGPDCLAL